MITFVQSKGSTNTAQTTSAGVTLDAPPTPGNLLVGVHYAGATDSTGPSTPNWSVALDAGFALETDDFVVYWKIAEADEPASHNFGSTTSDRHAAAIFEFASTDGWPASPVDVAHADGEGNGNSTALGPTAATAQAVEVAIAAVALHVGTTLTGFTDSFTGDVSVSTGSSAGSNRRLFAAYKVLGSAGAVSTTVSWSTSDNYSGAIVTFKDDSGGGDVTAPTLSGWATNTAGTEITATLSESGCTPASGSGGFIINGASASVAGWVISGTTLTISLVGSIIFGDTVTIDYADESASEAIADAADNLLVDFSGVSVTNNVPDSGDTTPPSVPTGGSADNGYLRNVLSWVDPADVDLASIKIYRSLTSGSGFTLLDTVAAGVEEYVDPSLTAGTTYYYKLSAVDTSDNESAQSAEFSGTPKNTVGYIADDRGAGGTFGGVGDEFELDPDTDPEAVITYTNPTPGTYPIDVYNDAGFEPNPETINYVVSDPGDTTKPTYGIPTITDNELIVTPSEAVTSLNISDYSISSNLADALEIIGITYDEVDVRVLLSRTVYGSETLTWSYVAGNTQDLAGNLMDSFSGASITNDSTFVRLTINPTATPETVTDNTTLLDGNISDGVGIPDILWECIAFPSGVPPVFDDETVETPTITFFKAGSYTFRLTVIDGNNVAEIDTVNVTVNQTLTSANISPTAPTVAINKTKQFTAIGLDQFTDILSPQPTWTWSETGDGTIDTEGLWSAPAIVPGINPTVKATNGLIETPDAIITVVEALGNNINIKPRAALTGFNIGKGGISL